MRPLHFLLILLCPLAGCSAGSASAYQGYLEGEFVNIGSSQGGQLEHLAVARGQRVELGAPLFSLEAASETAAVHQAQRQLDAARAQFADLNTGKRTAELDVIRAQLAQAQAAQTQAAAQFVRDDAQLQAGGLSQAQVEVSRELADSSAARVRELQSQLTVAELPGRTQQIRAQSAQVEAATAALEQARWKLEQKTVRAPRAGLVYDTIYREGEWVQAGSPIVRLLPPENLKLRFFVPETALGVVALGQRVAIHCDGCATDVLAGISYISAEAEYTPPVIYSNETRAKLIYRVEARPSPQDAARLHPGQPVEVRLQ